MKRIFYFLFFTLFGMNMAFSQLCESDRYQKAVFPDVTISKDLVYGSADVYDVLNIPLEFDQRLDIYEPAGDVLEKRPVVIMSFGGAYLIGDKEHADIEAWCDSLARYGYVAVAIDYRLGLNALSSGSATRAMYRGVQDTRAAIRFLLENKEEYKIDPENIYLGGESAGAINSLHTAFLTEESERPQETYGIPLENFDLGCLDCSGNDFDHEFEIKGIIDLWGAIFNLDLIDDDEKIPTLIIHGTDDLIVPISEGYPFVNDFQLTFPYLYSSEAIHQRMDALGIYNEYYPYDGQGHLFYGLPDGIITFPNEFWDPVWTQGHEFLFKTLQFETPLPQGQTAVTIGNNYNYSVPLNDGSVYCWEIIGGNVISENNSMVTVQWNSPTGSISVTEKNCIDVIGIPSGALEVNATTSVGNSFQNEELKIIPTLIPQGGNVAVFSNENVEIEFLIFDASGKMLQNKKAMTPYLFSTEHLGKGLYFIQIKEMDKVFYRKFVVN